MSSKKTEKKIVPVSVDDFDINKFKIGPLLEFKTGGTQSIALASYDDETFVLKTGPILISRGGIPKIDIDNLKSGGQSYRPTNKQCLYCWVPVSEDDPNSSKVLKVFKQIDEKNALEINTNKNNKYIVTKDGENYPHKLYYNDIVKEFDPSTFTTKSKTGDSEVLPYKRIKVVIPTEYKPDEPKDAEPSNFKVVVYENDEDGKPLPEPSKITTLDDLRQKLGWNSVVQFGLEIKKFWIVKQTDKKKPAECGLTVKMLTVYIVQKASRESTSGKITFDFFGTGDKSLEDDKDKSKDKTDIKKDKKENDKKKKEVIEDKKKKEVIEDKKKKKADTSESESDPSSDDTTDSDDTTESESDSDTSDSDKSSESDKKKTKSKK